jgi:ornithine cyclodeaminase/alanine dehydrogenase-like protein (mu-crystallin family)
MEQGLVRLEDVRELCEVVAGTRTGRTSDVEITLHKNNNGLGIADLAIAMCAYERL